MRISSQWTVNNISVYTVYGFAINGRHDLANFNHQTCLPMCYYIYLNEKRPAKYGRTPRRGTFFFRFTFPVLDLDSPGDKRLAL